MRHITFVTAALLCLLNMTLISTSAEPGFFLAQGDRMVFLGDSITDENTYPQIILQALQEAGKPIPTIICSGVVCDTAINMRDRMNKTVLPFQPKLVTFLAGTNDAARKESPEEYDAALRDIVKRVKAAGGTMLLITPCIINVSKSNNPNEAMEKYVSQYTEVLRKVALDEGLILADNNAAMRTAREAGKEVLSPDGCHPNYYGSSLLARSVLDALGYNDVPLPNTFQPQLFPGVIKKWQMRLTPLDPTTNRPQLLSEQNISTLKTDRSWKNYTLPDALRIDPATNQPESAEVKLQQYLRNGFGTRVDALIEKGHLQAVAIIKRKKAGNAYINIGGEESNIASLWLNGQKLEIPLKNDYEKPCIIGFHPGKLRIPIELKKGNNTLIMEDPGSFFFVSVTDTMVWEDEYCKGYRAEKK